MTPRLPPLSSATATSPVGRRDQLHQRVVGGGCIGDDRRACGGATVAGHARGEPGRHHGELPQDAVSTEEVRHLVRGRLSQHLHGRPHLVETAVRAEHRHPVAEQHRLVDVVGDETTVLPQRRRCRRRNSSCRRPRTIGVHGAERLVHQQHRRVGGERPGHADALALAAGELVRVAVGVLARGRARPARAARATRGPGSPAFSSRPACGTVATLAATVWCGKSPICWMT